MTRCVNTEAARRFAIDLPNYVDRVEIESWIFRLCDEIERLNANLAAIRSAAGDIDDELKCDCIRKGGCDVAHAGSIYRCNVCKWRALMDRLDARE